jgi:hypothetical protein
MLPPHTQPVKKQALIGISPASRQLQLRRRQLTGQMLHSDGVVITPPLLLLLLLCAQL